MHTDKTAILYLTAKGERLAKKIAHNLKGATLFGPGSLDEMPAIWTNHRALVFVMACGIAVRKIGPLLESKLSDPAVVVVDELGRNVISLLSGHVGGANKLAQAIASITGGAAVITTASDVNGLPSIDLMAQDLGFTIEHERRLPGITRRFIEDRKLTIYTMVPLGSWQALFQQAGANVLPEDDWKDESSVIVTDKSIAVKEAVILRPRKLWVGVGCRRGAGREQVTRAISSALGEAQLSLLSVAGLATIDIKRDERGLLEAAEELGCELAFFSAEQLNGAADRLKAKGYRISGSRFVKGKVGVESVCEMASMLASGMGTLILPKIVEDSVTVAIARAEEN